MSLAEMFLNGIRRFSADLDMERLRADVQAFVQRHPGLESREIAHQMVLSTARKAAAVGAVASLPPGFFALATLGPELSTILVMQSRLIVGLHILYGNEPEPRERALEVVAGLASGAGMHVTRRLSSSVAEGLASRLVVRAASRRAARVIPFAGAAVGAFVNYLAVCAVGKAAISRIERLYGPPGIAGSGRVVEVLPSSGKV